MGRWMVKGHVEGWDNHVRTMVIVTEVLAAPTLQILSS